MKNEINYFLKCLSIITDILTLVSLFYAFYYGIKKKTKNEIGFRLNKFFTWLMHFAFFILIFLLLYGLSSFLYKYLYAIIRDILPQSIQNQEIDLSMWISIFIQSVILLNISYRLIKRIMDGMFTDSNIFLNTITFGFTKLPEKISKSLYIKSAKYGANESFIDVTRILNSMISNNTLLITASNNISVDPIYDVVKKLIIVYNFEAEQEKKIEIEEGKTILITYENVKEI